MVVVWEPLGVQICHNAHSLRSHPLLLTIVTKPPINWLKIDMVTLGRWSRSGADQVWCVGVGGAPTKLWPGAS